MAANRKKLSAPARAGKSVGVSKPAATKKAVKKTAAKAVVKAPAKATTKSSAKTVAKPGAKARVKAGAKSAAKSAVKTPAAAVKKAAAKKSAKPAVKASAKAGAKAAAKPAARPAAKATGKKKVAAPKVSSKTAVKPVARKPAAKALPLYPAPKVAPVTASPAVNLKGLRGIQGAKAARIAQIVAESAAPKPVAPETTRPQTAVDAAAKASSSHAAIEAGSALDTVHKAAAVLFSKKAEDVVLMDLRNLSTVADYYLIATCLNEPQMRAILGTVQRALSREGIKALRSEYMPGVRWAVLDYGDVILHLFEKQTRGFYSLERLWGDAPSKPLDAADYAAPETEEDADEDGDL